MSAATIWQAQASRASTPRPRLRLVPDGAAAARSTGRLRLTRRGRLVVTTAMTAVLVVLGLAMVARGAVAAPAEGRRTVTVPAGATLSEIAARELPDVSVAQGVADLQRVNDLSTDQVRAGQSLVVPVR